MKDHARVVSEIKELSTVDEQTKSKRAISSAQKWNDIYIYVISFL